MSSYFIYSQKLNPKRVFILQKSELEKRWNPNTYHIELANAFGSTFAFFANTKAKQKI